MKHAEMRVLFLALKHSLIIEISSPSIRFVKYGINLLFNKFIAENLQITEVVACCDIAKLEHIQCEKLGFELIPINEPAVHFSFKNEESSYAINDKWLPVYDCSSAIYKWRK